jgi:hypothetical protein
MFKLNTRGIGRTVFEFIAIMLVAAVGISYSAYTIFPHGNYQAKNCESLVYDNISVSRCDISSDNAFMGAYAETTRYYSPKTNELVDAKCSIYISKNYEPGSFEFKEKVYHENCHCGNALDPKDNPNMEESVCTFTGIAGAFQNL